MNKNENILTEMSKMQISWKTSYILCFFSTWSLKVIVQMIIQRYIIIKIWTYTNYQAELIKLELHTWISYTENEKWLGKCLDR